MLNGGVFVVYILRKFLVLFSIVFRVHTHAQVEELIKLRIIEKSAKRSNLVNREIGGA